MRTAGVPAPVPGCQVRIEIRSRSVSMRLLTVIGKPHAPALCAGT